MREPFYRVGCAFAKYWIKELGPHTWAVYSILRAHADPHGKCYPSIKTLSNLSGVAERTVYRSLKALEDKNLIQKSSSPGQASTYSITEQTDTPPLPHMQVCTSVTPASQAPHPCLTGTPPLPHRHPTPASQAVAYKEELDPRTRSREEEKTREEHPPSPADPFKSPTVDELGDIPWDSPNEPPPPPPAEHRPTGAIEETPEGISDDDHLRLASAGLRPSLMPLALELDRIKRTHSGSNTPLLFTFSLASDLEDLVKSLNRIRVDPGDIARVWEWLWTSDDEDSVWMRQKRHVNLKNLLTQERFANHHQRWELRGERSEKLKRRERWAQELEELQNQGQQP